MGSEEEEEIDVNGVMFFGSKQVGWQWEVSFKLIDLERY